MYKIEKKDYGYRLTFGDFIQENEMSKWLDESRVALQTAPKSFGVFVDMRTLKPLPANAQKVMEEGQKLYKAIGMSRSVVILANVITKNQFKRIAQETGIYQWERYIDEASNPNWEKVGVDWIKNGIDPDK